MIFSKNNSLVIKTIYVFIIFIFVFPSALPVSGQASINRKKANYIYDFPKHIDWHGDEDIYIFKIAFIGNDTEMFNELKKVTRSEYPDGTVIHVERYSSIDQVEAPHMLYVCKDMNSTVPGIYKKIKNKNILLITNECPQKKYVMINFLTPKQGTVKFEINETAMSENGLIVTSNTLIDERNVITVKDLYQESEKENEAIKNQMQQMRNEIQNARDKLNKLEELAEKRKGEIEKQKFFIEIQKNSILQDSIRLQTTQDSLLKRQQELDELIAEVQKQNDTLKNRSREINKQKQETIELQEQITEHQGTLGKQKDEMSSQRRKIKTQNAVLKGLESELVQQQGYMIGIIVITLLIVVAAIFIYRGYKIKKNSNVKLEAKNKEINLQKDEIAKQAEQLKKTNHELDKLSIVARETDNAVIIMDSKGNFEWINEGYTRITGYTYSELIIEVSSNIIGSNTPPEIAESINRCIENKTTISYELKTKTKDGRIIWLQTTLTPILDADRNITKLIAIDSDISDLKNTQQKIQEQKAEIEEQNEQIRSSIRYAQTIQQAILPLNEDLTEFFDIFTLYWPKDIVSGDFFWYYHFVPENSQVESYFISVLDCTGHGVPGAFMSVVGNSILNEIIKEKKIHKPSKILENLNINIKTALKQEQTQNDDGMDLLLCRIDVDKTYEQPGYNLTFSGARRPLIYFDSQKSEIVSIRGDRKSVGGKRCDRQNIPFTDKEIQLKTDDVVYLSTDGVIHQHAPDRAKFGSKRLIAILNKIGMLPLEEQKDILEKAISDHKKTEEQRDDITLIGFKIS